MTVLCCGCKERDAANEKLLECQDGQKQLQKAAANATWQLEPTVDGFRNPATQLKKVLYLTISQGFYTSQVVVGNFLNHQRYVSSVSWSFIATPLCRIWKTNVGPRSMLTWKNQQLRALKFIITFLQQGEFSILGMFGISTPTTVGP